MATSNVIAIDGVTLKGVFVLLKLEVRAHQTAFCQQAAQLESEQGQSSQGRFDMIRSRAGFTVYRVALQRSSTGGKRCLGVSAGR